MGGKGSGGYRPGSLTKENNPAVQANKPGAVEDEVLVNTIDMGMEMMALPNLSFQSVDELAERLEWYFDACKRYHMRPMVVGMANAFGMNRQVFSGIGRGDKHYDNWHGITTECKDFLQKAYEKLEGFWENYLESEKGNPVKWIFLGKNHFGYKDQAEKIVRNVDESPKGIDSAEVAKKYAGMLGKPTPVELEVIDVETLEPEQLSR